ATGAAMAWKPGSNPIWKLSFIPGTQAGTRSRTTYQGPGIRARNPAGTTPTLETQSGNPAGSCPSHNLIEFKGRHPIDRRANLPSHGHDDARAADRDRHGPRRGGGVLRDERRDWIRAAD